MKTYKILSPNAMRSLFTGLLLLLGATYLQAQGGFKGRALSDAVNTEYDELVPRLSPDNKTLYFVRSQHPNNAGGRAGGQDIWASQRAENGQWLPAVNLGAPLNNDRHNMVGGVTTSGHLLLSNTYYPDPNENRPGISESVMEAGKWGNPQQVVGWGDINAEGRYIDFYVTPDQRTMVLSMSVLGQPQEDLYVCFANFAGGTWSKPQSLGSIINTIGFETGPFLTADTKTLFFTSSGLGGQGNADIFMATRLDDTWQNWSEPMNLGTAVNTAGFDGHFIVDSKGLMAYFVSGPNPTALGDIYEIPMSELDLPGAPTVDTLRIFAKSGQKVNVNLEPYGVTPQNKRFVTIRPNVAAKGTLTTEGDEPTYTYGTPNNFQGKDYVTVEYCDPPQSDDCRKVVIEANVTKPGEQPLVQRYDLRTPKNQSVPLIADIPGLNARETRRVYVETPGPHGNIGFPAGISPTLIYEPPTDFVGTDSLKIYGQCPDDESANCLKAIVKIEVYDQPVIAIVTPKDTVIPVVVKDTVIPIVVKDTVVPIVVKDTVIPLPTELVVRGIVTDAKSGKPLDAELSITENGKEIAHTKSNPTDGSYTMTVPTGHRYMIEAKQPYYFPTNDLVPPADAKGNVKKDIAMEPLPLEVGQSITLKNIYFDTDKSILKPASKDELTRLYDLMVANPTLEIEIKGHTDSQASDEHNQALSEARAAAVVNYLKYKGVMGYRMGSKGFEEGRALNRRVEFTVVKL
jgi:outer membrane protein OmpA-like peptidoglycan-associated protein